MRSGIPRVAQLAGLPALAALAALADPALAQRARLESILRDTTLENGLQVIVVRNRAIPLVSIQMAFRGGAIVQQVPEYAGLPHLIEHILFRSDGGDFAEKADAIDADWNGVTDSESVRYFFTIPSRHLGKGIDLMADLVRKPDFGKSVVDAERKVVQGELERRASEPDMLLRTEADMMLWGPDGFLVKNAGGNLIALMAATPARLTEMYKKFYVPNNAALIVAGDVEPADAFSLAARAFRGWRPGPDPMAGLTATPIQPLKAVAKKIVTAEVKDVTFLIRWQGPSVTKHEAATFAADIFSGLVNQRASATQRRLVDSGLLDEVSMNYETLNYVGPISIMARTSPDRAVSAANALGAELKKLVEPDYFTEDDLALARTWQEVNAHFRLERSAGAAGSIASFWSASGLAYFMNYADKLEAQTATDVRKFVDEWINDKPMAVTVRVSPAAWPTIGVPLQRALGAWTVP